MPADPAPRPDQRSGPAPGADTSGTAESRAGAVGVEIDVEVGAPVGAPVEQLAEFGGDSACWLARVCPDCGRITEGRDPDRCSSCGQTLGTA